MAKTTTTTWQILREKTPIIIAPTPSPPSNSLPFLQQNDSSNSKIRSTLLRLKTKERSGS